MQLRYFLATSMFATTMLFAQAAGQPAPATQPVQSATAAPAAAASSVDPGPMLGPPEMKFLTDAARGSMFELRVADLAQEKAASAEVKQFAQKLKQDHTKANQQLEMIAKERQVQMPADIGDHQKELTKLTGLSGEAFDKEFIKMQVKDHKKDISMFRKHAEKSMDSDLRDFATNTVPVLEGHLQQAQSLAKN